MSVGRGFMMMYRSGGLVALPANATPGRRQSSESTVISEG